MNIIKQIINSFVFWGAWIIIPVLMEIIPALGSVLLLLKRHFKSKKHIETPALYPEISIIIPIYNSENTLFQCIQSINNSTYPNDRIRIFLVNNQGKDHSFQVYEKCQKEFSELHMQWLNAEQGKSRALNLALYSSEGKYIINIDSDGILEPHALTNMIDKFENNTELNCMSGAILTDPHLIKQYKRFFPRLLRELEFMEYAQAFLAGRSYASEMDRVYTLSGAFSAFRKSAVLKSRLYNTETISEDTQITFQMRYLFHERVEICEDAIFFVDPIEGVNKLYTQRQRWQRGSLEVARMFMDKSFRLSQAFKDVNVKTLLYDHTFAFPRMIWYLALLCLMFLNYSSRVIIYSTLLIFALYIVVGFFYFFIVSAFLKFIPDIRKYYRHHWWCVFLLPFFNFIVFFIRMAGIINSIYTNSSWSTKNLTEEFHSFISVIKNDVSFVKKKLNRLKDKINHRQEEKKTEFSLGWSMGIGILCFASIAFIFIVYWVKKTYGVSVHEIVNTLKGPIEGTGGAMIEKIIFGCVLPVVIMFIVIVIFAIIGYRLKRKHNGKIQRMLQSMIVVFSVFSLIVAVIYANNQFDLLDYYKNNITSTSIYEDYYVNPDSITISSTSKPKNLIYIYVESMESTYASLEDGGKQYVNYIPQLTKMAKDNISFGDSKQLSGFHEITGTTWTLAALFATTSGVPYTTPYSDEEMSQQEQYFPGIVTLGDILEKQGYNQEFLCGSDAKFANRKAYYTQHGNYKIFDVYTAKEKGYIPQDYWHWWGFEDSVLYKIAKDEILNLAAQEKPFNMTMLTVDMHAPDGYKCELCKDDYGELTANVVSCADKQIAEFLSWCQQQDFYKDTAIVITGDHPRMDSSLVDGVSYYERTVYNCFINSSIESQQNTHERLATAVDIFPSVLAAMGFDIEGDCLGLGVNLFSNQKTLAEAKGFDWFDQEVSKQSDYYINEFTKENKGS